MFQLYRLQDAHLEDSDLLDSYYKEFFGGNITKAHQIVENNQQLNSKVLNSKNLNRIVDSIIEMEKWYDKDVPQVLNDKLKKYQINIDELLYLTDYNGQTQYEKFNFVLYNEEIYFCKKTPPKGTSPINSQYWVYLGLKGERGTIGTGLNYKGNWSSSMVYKQKDMIVYQKTIYVARVDNTNQKPVTVSNYWMPLINISDRGMYISKTPPKNIGKGQIWVELL